MKPNLKSPVYVIGYAALVSGAFTAAIMALHVATEGIVDRNERLLRERALVGLFQLGRGRGKLSDEQIARIVREQIDESRTITDPQTGHVFRLVQARDPQGRLIGYAFPVWGIGFWARIDGLLAVDPACTRVIGVVFLKHSETPGLGGRITEKAWTEQFRGLDVAPPGAGGQYIYIGGVAPADAAGPRSGRYVDAITGATGTSKAVEKFLNERTAEFRRAAVAAGLLVAPGPAPAAGGPTTHASGP